MLQIVDLGKPTSIDSVRINFYQYNNAWIFLPKKLQIQVSKDNKNWIDYGTSRPKAKPELRGKFIEQMGVRKNKTDIRYVKIIVQNLAKVPQWHEAAGADAWIFMDEIIIN